MGYRKTTTNTAAHIVHLYDLNRSQERLCHNLRKEAGRLWTDMVKAHVASRDGKWLSSRDLEIAFKNGYALHSQSIQALAQKLAANVETALVLIKENPDARLPYREKAFQTVIWKRDGIRLRDGVLILSNGRGREPLSISLPERYQNYHIQQVELTWDVNHYCLCLNTDTGLTDAPLTERRKTLGVDMGEIHIAAAVTDKGESLVISGRVLRSVKRLRNKRHSQIASKKARCTKGSRRWKRLQKAKNKASSKFNRQQRDILHKASRQLVSFAKEKCVARIALGDVKDCADGVSLGPQSNQKISQWSHGQFGAYVTYKARFVGIATDYTPEHYTSKTCPFCGFRKKQAPRGRNFVCSGCGSKCHRDVVGGANIASRSRYGELAKVQPLPPTYLRPLQGGRSRRSEPAQVAILQTPLDL